MRAACDDVPVVHLVRHALNRVAARMCTTVVVLPPACSHLRKAQLEQSLFAENRMRLHARHGVADAAPDVQSATVRSSVDARDYCLDTRDLSNLRTQLKLDNEADISSTDDGQSPASKVCKCGFHCLHAASQ